MCPRVFKIVYTLNISKDMCLDKYFKLFFEVFGLGRFPVEMNKCLEMYFAWEKWFEICFQKRLKDEKWFEIVSNGWNVKLYLAKMF